MNVLYFFRGLHKKSGDRMREVLGGLPGLTYLPFTWDEEESHVMICILPKLYVGYAADIYTPASQCQYPTRL
jgi:hypothetical protein